MHSDRHRQAGPIGASLVNKNLRPGCTVFSLCNSAPPPFLSPLSLLRSISPLSPSPPAACLPQSIALHRHRFNFPVFLSRFDLYAPPPQIFFHSCISTLSPCLSLFLSFHLFLVPTSYQAGNRAVSHGADTAAEYQIEGKAWRQKKRERERERERETEAMMSQLRRDLPTQQRGCHHTCHPRYHHPLVNGSVWS